MYITFSPHILRAYGSRNSAYIFGWDLWYVVVCTLFLQKIPIHLSVWFDFPSKDVFFEVPGDPLCRCNVLPLVPSDFSSQLRQQQPCAGHAAELLAGDFRAFFCYSFSLYYSYVLIFPLNTWYIDIFWSAWGVGGGHWYSRWMEFLPLQWLVLATCEDVFGLTFLKETIRDCEPYWWLGKGSLGWVDSCEETQPFDWT